MDINDTFIACADKWAKDELDDRINFALDNLLFCVFYLTIVNICLIRHLEHPLAERIFRL